MSRVVGANAAVRAMPQVLGHAGVRLLSGALSFYLFGLIARRYGDDDVKHIYFFLFVFGFAAAALRTLGNVSAGVDRRRSRSANARRIVTAYGEVMLVSLAAVPCALWLLAPHVEDRWLLGVAAIVLCMAALDGDMTRALLDQRPLFSSQFAIGSAAAVGVLLAADPAWRGAAIIALLLQWVPVGAGNLRILARLAGRALHSAWRRLRIDASVLATLMCMALFDGIVLNLPFFLGRSVPLETSLDIAVVVRLFSASLIFSPLVLHWSNSVLLGQMAQSTNLPRPLLYFALQLVPAMVCGLAFALAFHIIAARHVAGAQIAAFLFLVLCFCVYGTVTRFRGQASHLLSLPPSLALACGILFAVTTLVLHAGAGSALVLALLQGGALLLGGALVWSQTRTGGAGPRP